MPSALGLIGTYSKGIPRNINNLCFQALSLGYAKGQKKIDDTTVREVLADLDLESLGTLASAAPKKAAAPIPRQRKLGVDAVDLFSGSLAGDREMPDRSEPDYRRALVRSGRKRDSGVLAWVGLGALLVGVCMWPWIKPELGSWAHFIDGGLSSPKSAQVTSPPATPAPANPAPVQTETPGDRTDQGSDSAGAAPLQPGAPDAPSTSSEPDTPREANPPAPTPKLATHQAPRRLNTLARDPGLVSETRYLPGSGRLVVESSVSGAHISIDGESNPKWLTPWPFNLAPGTYLVSVFRPGYGSWNRRIHIDEGKEYYLSAELVDMNQDGGIFTVDTDPPGMQVFIDGKPYGPSRVDTVLSAGWHVCAVVPGPGLQAVVSRFHLRPGEAVTRRVKLGPPIPGSSENNPLDRGKHLTTLAAIPEGGLP